MSVKEITLKLGKGLLHLIIAIFIISILVFFMSRLAPGNPLKSYYGDSLERMSIEHQENAKERLGLNEPLYIQYVKWLENALQGDFGISYKYKQDVVSIINQVGFNTLILGGISYILTFGLALLLGAICALKEDTFFDKFVCKVGTVTSCIPAFFFALLFILVFSINLDWFPTGGAYGIGQEDSFLNRAYHLILPVSVLVLGHLWYYAYMIRNKLLEEARQDYVLLCKVKGLSKGYIMRKHCVRNIIPSLVSIMAISLPHTLGGIYIVEKVFSYPGLGTVAFESARFHDYNMLMVLCLLTGIIVIVANMIAQVINEYIDPRLKFENHERGWTV